MNVSADHSSAPGTPSGRDPDAALLRMSGISKSFAGVTVLSNVQFELRPGEVHILAGENGAGKSTLIKIIAGVHAPDCGALYIGGQPVTFRSPHEAADAGVAVIHQEMSLIGSLSVADNIYLGREITRAGILKRGEQRRRSTEVLQQFGLDLDVDAPVENYPLGVQQMIEIAKALSGEARIIIMDEPTSALTEPEVEKLFALVASLKARGCGIIYISHKMQEIYRIADRITVLRDGEYIGTETAGDMGPDELVRRMVGRDLAQQFPRHFSQPGRECLRVENLMLPDPAGTPRMAVDGVSFAARKGEILGFAGLQGSGNSELFGALFGAYGRKAQGRVLLDGEQFPIISPRRSVRQGIAFLTNDRKGTGLVLGMDIRENTTLASLPQFSPGAWVRPGRERETTLEWVRELGVRCASIDQEVGALSGGNQQKVVLAKWLQIRPRVLMLDEPTRGVDIGAKHEIYELMERLARQGCTILLITSEMPELLAMADRILVMHRGHITAEFSHEEATQEAVLQAAMGERANVSSHC